MICLDVYFDLYWIVLFACFGFGDVWDLCCFVIIVLLAWDLRLLVVDYLEFRSDTVVVWYLLLLMLGLVRLLFSFNLGVLVVFRWGFVYDGLFPVWVCIVIWCWSVFGGFCLNWLLLFALGLLVVCLFPCRFSVCVVDFCLICALALVSVLMIGDLDVFRLVYLFDEFCGLVFDFEFGYLVGFGVWLFCCFCFWVCVFDDLVVLCCLNLI